MQGGRRLEFGIGLVPHEADFTTSIWGSRSDLVAVLQHARRGELSWEVETLPLARFDEALARLRRGDVRERLVLTP
jgi:propanol-preferring alcohol dehydrogenase